MSKRWSFGLVSAAALAGSILVSLSLSGCGKEGDTVVIYADGGSAGANGNAGSTGTGGSGSTGVGGDAQGGDGSLASGGNDAAGGTSGAGATSGSGGGSAGNDSAGGNAAGGAEGGGAGNGTSGTGGTPYEGALFVEDFEDGNDEGWRLGDTLDPGTYEVTTDQAANGSSRSLSLTGGEGYYSGHNMPLEALKPSKVSWWVRAAGSVGTVDEGFFALSANPDEVDPILMAKLGLLGISIEAGDTLKHDDAAMPDQWYHFELEMDWEAETFVAKVNGLSLGEAAFGTSGLNGIWRIDLFNANGIADNVVYYDEIVMMP